MSIVTYVLAEKVEALKEGKKWDWLFQRANPLGNPKATKKFRFFTIITMPDEAALATASGRSSSFWKDEWLVAYSRQTHELGCMSGIIEWA